jgi:hypothetical protein
MEPPILTKAGFLFSEAKRLDLEAEYLSLPRTKFEKAGVANGSPFKPFLRWFYATVNILPLFFGIGQNKKYLLRKS